MFSEQSSTPSTLIFNGVEIIDTFAEAFPIKAARLVITATNERWARTAATVLCGNATSVIACDVEAAIERDVPASETPDGRGPAWRSSSGPNTCVNEPRSRRMAF